MIAEILEKVPTSLLVDVFFAKGLKSEKRRPPREEVFPQIVKLIGDDSLKQFVYLMQKKELKGWAKKIAKHVLAARNNNSNSCAVMRKRLFEQLRDNGLEQYMEKLHPTDRLLVKTLQDMGIPAEKTDGTEELSKKLISEIAMVGIESFLKNTFTVSQLKEIAEVQGITAQTSSPNILTECIITGKDYAPEKKIVKKKKKKPTAEKEKEKEELVDPLLDGTTFEERAPWKLIDRIIYEVSDTDSDDEKDWVDHEKLKDVSYVDEAPEVAEEKTRKRDKLERMVNVAVDYTLVETEEVKKKKKRGKKKDGESNESENDEESDPEFVIPSKKRKHREDDEDRKERKKRKEEKKRKHKKEKENKEKDGEKKSKKDKKHKKHKSSHHEGSEEEKQSNKSEEETEKSEKNKKHKKDKVKDKEVDEEPQNDDEEPRKDEEEPQEKEKEKEMDEDEDAEQTKKKDKNKKKGSGENKGSGEKKKDKTGKKEIKEAEQDDEVELEDDTRNKKSSKDVDDVPTDDEKEIESDKENTALKEKRKKEEKRRKELEKLEKLNKREKGKQKK